MIDSNKLLKYGEYLKETLDPWKLKQGIKSFNRQKEDVLTIHGDLKDLSYEQKINLSENEMLNKRQNEEWFIKTVLIINGNYKTAFLPVDQQIPFGSFEELLIWYFNN